jgi:UDP-N-acetylglucosamine 2-epimerase (non-hydrolysing)
MKNILFVFGTRPEAIKMAPLVIKAKQDSRFNVFVCSTGQHREMLKPILNFFEIVPDLDLDLMKPGQTLADVSVAVLQGVDAIFKQKSFSAVVVQGDTTSCFMGGLAAFYHKVPVVHIEAGLRSGDIFSPFPEEFNRKATGLLAHLHFAPTETSRANLLNEHYPSSRIFVTGNTGIDALFAVRERLAANQSLKEQFEQHFAFLDIRKKLILVTVHRRESFGEPMEEVMKGLKALSKRSDVELLIPLHMNPQVRESAKKIFGSDAKWVNETSTHKLGTAKIWLCEPVDYIPFVYLMNRAFLIITDSGGVQEEAPSLGKPILVAREKTERPEAITAGTSKLIPLQEHAFLRMAEEIINDSGTYLQMAQAQNPFGDGQACGRILEKMAELLP